MIHARCIGWIVAPLLCLVPGASPASAKDVSFCNGSPVKVDLAVAAQFRDGFRSFGWFAMEPGSCRQFRQIGGTQVSYYAQSYTPLAKWLSEADSITWSGFTRLCFHPAEAFNLPARAECPNRVGFQSASIPHEANTITFYEKHHRGIDLSDAPEFARVLTGRMDHENYLKANPGREAAFQIGINMEEGAYGPRIMSVHAGLPAEEEGLQPGDQILTLDGQKISTRQQLVNLLDGLSLFRTNPLSMTVLRGGSVLQGSIVPAFYPFNHREYDPNGHVGAFTWSLANNVPFGFGHELACGSAYLLGELVSSFAEDRDFNSKSVGTKASRCSDDLNRELQKKEILYSRATVAGAWASLVVPGIPIAKAARATRAVPLAARSSKVARTTQKSLRSAVR